MDGVRRVDLGLVVILIAAMMVNAMLGKVTAEDTTITGNVKGAIKITAPDDISWELDPSITQPNTQTGTLHVKANKDWQVTAKDADTTNTNGYMAEWDGSTYISGGKKLSNAMKVSAASEVTLPTGGVVQTGTRTGGLGQDVTVTFKQEVTWDDEALTTEGHVYRIVVTFTGSLTP